MSKSLLILFLTPFLFAKTFAQHTNAISLEGGAVINKPLQNGERITSNGQSTTSEDWKYNYYSSTSSFVKFSYEKHLISKNRISFYFPIGLTFMTQKTQYDLIGWSRGCFGGQSADELKKSTLKNINVSFGYGLQYELKKFRYIGNINLNNCITVKSQTQSIPYNSSDKFYDKYTRNRYNLYLSSQFCFLYKIKNNLSFGPSCEIFYRNISAIVIKMANPDSYHENFDPSLYITGKNILINPGVKLQLGLK